MQTIELVYDAAPESTGLSVTLTRSGFQCTEISDPVRAIEVAVNQAPTMILVDVNTGPMSGLRLITALRQITTAPLMVLASAPSEADQVRALELGADDYLVKPVSERVLVARIAACLRRHGGQPSTGARRAGSLEVLADELAARCGELKVRLSPTEFRLLNSFATRPNITLTVDFLLRDVWGDAECYSGDVVRVAVHRLRHKLSALGSGAPNVQAVPGVGYRLEPMDLPASAAPEEQLESAFTGRTQQVGVAAAL